MGVHDGLAIVRGDISNQREQLYLLLHKPHRGERANGLEARIGKVLLSRKVLEALCNFVPSVENERIASSHLELSSFRYSIRFHCGGARLWPTRQGARL